MTKMSLLNFGISMSKKNNIRCIFPNTLNLLERFGKHIDKIEDEKLQNKIKKEIEKLPECKGKDTLSKFVFDSKNRLLVCVLDVGDKQFAFDYMKHCSDTFKLKCMVNDLSKKKYYIDRSIELFRKNYDSLKLNSKKSKLPDYFTENFIDCYFFFESFLYQSKAFLDVLVKFYAEILKNKYQLKYLKYKTFNAFRKSIIDKSNSLKIPQHLVDYFVKNTDWFKYLKEYRDMISHLQGYNPSIVKEKDGSINSLSICTVYAFNHEKKFSYGGLNLFKSISTINHGIEDIIKFSDDFLSNHLLEQYENQT